MSAKKMFKIGDEINCVITEIDKEKEGLQFHIESRLKILLKHSRKNTQWVTLSKEK